MTLRNITDHSFRNTELSISQFFLRSHMVCWSYALSFMVTLSPADIPFYLLVLV